MRTLSAVAELQVVLFVSAVRVMQTVTVDRIRVELRDTVTSRSAKRLAVNH